MNKCVHLICTGSKYVNSNTNKYIIDYRDIKYQIIIYDGK